MGGFDLLDTLRGLFTTAPDAGAHAMRSWEDARRQLQGVNPAAAGGVGAASQWGPAWADDTGTGGLLDRFRTPRFDAARAYEQLGIDPNDPVPPDVQVPLDNPAANSLGNMGASMAIAQMLDEPPPVPLPARPRTPVAPLQPFDTNPYRSSIPYGGFGSGLRRF